jgi:hypothetical protein
VIERVWGGRKDATEVLIPQFREGFDRLMNEAVEFDLHDRTALTHSERTRVSLTPSRALFSLTIAALCCVLCRHDLGWGDAGPRPVRSNAGVAARPTIRTQELSPR